VKQRNNAHTSTSGKPIIILFIILSCTFCKDTDTDLIPAQKAGIISIMQATKAVIKATGENFRALATYLCPNTLQPEF
jgi:hypothetical protein